MPAEQRLSQGIQLEGIVLRNGRGDLYEVPCLVIERYRVSEERATELTAELGSVWLDSDEGHAEDDVAPWSVQGGVYIDSSDVSTPTADLFPH